MGHHNVGSGFQTALDRLAEIAWATRALAGVQRDVLRSELAMMVVRTDATLFGSFNMQAGRPTGKHPLIEELEKQFDVSAVSPDQPIGDEYDALLVVQPSSLTQPQMDNLVAAIRSGRPTAIFEDPMPTYFGPVPGTMDPRRSQNPQMAMFGGGQPPPKGRISGLWDLLGVIWQHGHSC